MESKGLSRFIPDAVLDAYKPALRDGWEMATFLFMVGVWLAVIADLIVGFSISFDTGLEGFWSASDTLFISLPLVAVVFTLVVRHQAPHSTTRGLWLLDGAITLTFLFGLLSVVAGVIGIFSSFGNGTFATVVGGILFHVADIALGVAVVVWALNELGALRKHMPATTGTVAAAPATWGAPVPAAGPTPPATGPVPAATVAPAEGPGPSGTPAPVEVAGPPTPVLGTPPPPPGDEPPVASPPA